MKGQPYASAALFPVWRATITHMNRTASGPQKRCKHFVREKIYTPAGLCAPNRPHCALLYLRTYTIFLLVFFFTPLTWQRILKGISKLNLNSYKYVRSVNSVGSLVLISQTLQDSLISPVNSILRNLYLLYIWEANAETYHIPSALSVLMHTVDKLIHGL